ncbi:hypothetical protein Q3G72_021631 [Acer saccharum]|nr:hypothetical protein Q3G72_021631 [Acer saccharum]
MRGGRAERNLWSFAVGQHTAHRIADHLAGAHAGAESGGFQQSLHEGVVVMRQHGDLNALALQLRSEITRDRDVLVCIDARDADGRQHGVLRDAASEHLGADAGRQCGERGMRSQ